MTQWAEWVWLNGRLIRASEAHLSVFDRGFLLGDGLFETLRASAGRLFRPERHLERLLRGAGALSLSPPAALEELLSALRATLHANHLEEAVLRLTLSRGVSPPGLAIEGAGAATCVVTARPFAGYPRCWYEPGATAILSRVVKNEQSPLCGLKTTSWLEHVLARAEAAEQGADEALLRNTRGGLVEGSGTNLFLIRGGQILTPDRDSGCLPGVTRETVLDLARELGLETLEARLPPSSLSEPDEAFLTNSLLGVAPLIRIDGQPIGAGHAGAITGQLADAYRALVSRDAV